jgi:hypothetical protein
VDRERLQYFEVARIPWSSTDKLGGSLHLKATAAADPAADSTNSTAPPTAEEENEKLQQLLLSFFAIADICDDERKEFMESVLVLDDKNDLLAMCENEGVEVPNATAAGPIANVATDDACQASPVESAPEQHLLVMYGDPLTLLGRCTNIYMNGRELPLTEERTLSVVVKADAMAEDGLAVSPDHAPPLLVGFAQRWLPIDQFPPGCQVVSKIPGHVQFSEEAQREISGDEINFPLDELTYLGQVSVFPPSVCEPATQATLVAAETCLRQQQADIAMTNERDQEDRLRRQAAETEQLIDEAQAEQNRASEVALQRALAAEKRAGEAADFRRVGAGAAEKVVELADLASAKAGEIAAAAAQAGERATVSFIFSSPQ